MQALQATDYEWILSPDLNLLKDDHMDYFAYLMELQYGFPFQESWKIQVPEFIEPLDANKQHIQLLHSRDGVYDQDHREDDSDHWVCSFYDTQTIYILDSTWTIHKKIHPKWLIFLRKLYPFYPFETHPIQFVPVQRQTNTKDCGVFAIAFATSILNDEWPDQANVKFDVRKMRQHLVNIFKEQNIVPFPKIANPNTSRDRNIFHIEKKTLWNHETKEKRVADVLLENPVDSIKRSLKSQTCNGSDFIEISREKDMENHQIIEILSSSSKSSTLETSLQNTRVNRNDHSVTKKQNENSDKAGPEEITILRLRNAVLDGERLNDAHMLQFSGILGQYSDYRPRDTLYLRRPERIQPVLPNQKHIQILFSSNEHWVCSYYDCKRIYIYDSLNLRYLHPDHRLFLRHLFPFYNVEDRNMTFCRVQYQPNLRDCGVYAIAFAISIVYCQKPDLIDYDHSLMRQHLCTIYETHQLSHFPIVQNRNLHPELPSLDVIRTRELRAYRKRKLRYEKADDKLSTMNDPKQIKLCKINVPGMKTVKPQRCNDSNTVEFFEKQTENNKATKIIPLSLIKSHEKSTALPQTPICKMRRKDSKNNKKMNKQSLILARKIKSKYRRIEVAQNCLKQSFSSEKYIQQLTDKIEVGSILENRLEAERIIKWSLQQRKNYTKNLYHTLEILRKKSDHHLSKMKPHYDSVKDKLRDICGSSKHRISSESYFYETSYVFQDLQDIILVMNSKGQAVNVMPLIMNKKKIDKKYWKCTQFCRIFHNKTIVDNYQVFLEALKHKKLRTFRQFLHHLINTSHVGNKLGHLSNCYIENSCCNQFFSTLQLLSPHFPTVRYVKDLIYRMNTLFNKLDVLDKALNSSDVNLLKEITDNIKLKGDRIDIDNNLICLDEDLLQKQFKQAFLDFSKRSLDTPSHMCISCQKLCYPREVQRLSNLNIPILNPNFDELIPFYLANYESGPIYDKYISNNDFICKYCLTNFRTKNLPSTCVLNNLHVGEIPDELRHFNDYEKILIQRAKAFQVVQRAGTIANKKLPHKSRIQKMKGQTFYLPLPLEETIKKICPTTDPINRNHEFYILVRGIPTKANVVWENLVDVNKVFQALLKLKEINGLYSEIQLPASADDLFSFAAQNNVEYTVEPEGESHGSDLNESTLNDDKSKTKVDGENKKAALLTQVVEENKMYAKYTIHPMHDQRIYASSTKLYQMLKVKDIPLNFHLKSLDLLCFPDLYPRGKNGLHEERSVRLTDSAYIKTRLLSADPRFRLNQQYLFFLQHDAYIRQVNSGIYHLLNITNPKERINANQYLAKLEKGELEGRIDTIFERVRNSEQYWRIPRNDLDCMIQNYGPATWFLTVSPAEWMWEDLIHYLRTVNSPYCDKYTPGELIASDPVSVSRFIDNKFQAILDFILSKSHPIGKIMHYFWRREYQSRGIPHFHMVIWVEDAPILGVNPNEDIIAFIIRYVTCKIPPKTLSPNLHRRVTTHQKHHHTTYCLREKKLNSKTSKVCRFGFSRPVTDTFVLRNTAGSVAGRKKLKTKCRLYDLPRTKEEENINDYNPAILTAWEGNMDIQFIGEQSGLLTVYCTKYASKPEVTGSDFDMLNDINRTKTVRQLLWNIAFRSLNHREVGAIEVADTLLGLSLYRTDPNTVIRWLDVRQVRNRRVKSRDHIETLDPESTDIFYPSFIDNHYPARPKELESISLYDFAKWYDFTKIKPVKKNITHYPMGSSGYLKKRKHGYLINHYKFNPKIQPENYYFSPLLLFKPWRDTDELRANFATFTESFMHYKDELLEAHKYHERLAEIRKGFEDIQEEIERELQKNNDNPDSDDDEVLLGCDPVEAKAAMQDFRDFNIQAKEDSVDLDQLINQMNHDQKRIFEKVKNALRTNDSEVLRLYVSGEGGTGKSFLIEVIQRWIRKGTLHDVAITAPTGLAAFNINGLTIHKLLQLPVEHGSGILKYRQLSDKALKVLREELKDVALMIIDEISMVSNLTLLFINFRLIEIFNSVNEADNGWFGGKHILVFGDLLQLPPVRANPTYVKLTQAEMDRHVGALATFNIWENLFSYDELTIKMRQKTDTNYGEILSRLRCGMISEEDINFIRTREIPHDESLNYDQRLQALCQYIKNLPPDTVCLLATCKQCKILNDEMLNQISSDEILLNSLDEYSGAQLFRKRAFKLLDNFEDDATETAGLLKQIRIKIGAKIMIRRNIDVPKGVVNGTIGTIRSVSTFLDRPEIEFVTISLSSGDECILERVSAKIQIVDGAFIIRRQFPICLSYGMTIHKSQGLSLNNAIIDVGNTVFTSGQTYVALSRVRTLNGLHLINFDPHSIKINTHALEEYNRLRKIDRPDLPLYEIVPKTWQKNFDYIWAVENFNLNDIFPIDPIPISSNWTIRGFQEPNRNLSYADTAIQAFFNCTTIRKELKKKKNVTNTGLSLLLTKYMNESEVLNSHEVRDSVGDPFNTEKTQDPAHFIQALCQADNSLYQLVKHTLHFSTTCITCAYTSSYDVTQSIFPVSLADNHKNMSFLEMFATLFTRNRERGFCLNCKDMKQLLIRTEITSVNSVIILKFEDDASQDQSTKKGNHRISAVPASKLIICNKKYQVNSAILYHPDSNAKSYISMLRSNKSDWFTVNGAEIRKSRWPTGSKNVYILYLEICGTENITNSKRRKTS